MQIYVNKRIHHKGTKGQKEEELTTKAQKGHKEEGY